jgi:hypothetical protein
MKYVILETQHGQRLPFLFPELLVHAQMAEVFKAALQAFIHVSAVPVSAGHASIQGAEIHGESESLELVPLAGDEARMVLGDSIAFLPDERLLPLYELYQRGHDVD